MNFRTHLFTILLFKCLLQEEFRQYGIDWNGPVGTGDDNMVEVPDTLFPFSDHILSQLRTFVPIVSAHPYCACELHATSCHVMHRARAQSTKMNK